MCGIIGYSGHRPAVPLLVEGLHRLEYRGYDSSGVAFEQAGSLHVVKAAGKLAALEAKLENNAYLLATSGIGHTRWATHGLPVERNAHPHLSQDGRIAIIHNGIIENFQELKDELTAKGHTFLSDTDTEVLAHLIGEERKSAPSLIEAFARALRRAHGAYAVVMMSVEEPGDIYAARMAAPLLMGVGVGECFVASDIPAFLPYTRDVVFLEDGEIARISGMKWQVFSLADLSPLTKTISHVPWDMQAAAKGGYKHFMLKEIMEQPRVITDCMTGRVTEESDGTLSVHLQELDDLPVPSRLHIVACGTSYNAGLWGQQLLENVGGIPTDLDIASEFRYRDPILLPGEAVMERRRIHWRPCVLPRKRGVGSSVCAMSWVLLLLGRRTLCSTRRPGRKLVLPLPRPCAVRWCLLRSWHCITAAVVSLRCSIRSFCGPCTNCRKNWQQRFLPCRREQGSWLFVFPQHAVSFTSDEVSAMPLRWKELLNSRNFRTFMPKGMPPVR